MVMTKDNVATAAKGIFRFESLHGSLLPYTECFVIVLSSSKRMTVRYLKARKFRILSHLLHLFITSHLMRKQKYQQNHASVPMKTSVQTYILFL